MVVKILKFRGILQLMKLLRTRNSPFDHLKCILLWMDLFTGEEISNRYSSVTLRIAYRLQSQIDNNNNKELIWIIIIIIQDMNCIKNHMIGI